MLMNGDSQFAIMWSDYSQNLVEAVREPEDVITFRNRWPEKFRSICVTQLSFVLDTPLDLLSTFENQNNVKNTPMKRLLSCTRRRLGSKFIFTILNFFAFLIGWLPTFFLFPLLLL